MLGLRLALWLEVRVRVSMLELAGLGLELGLAGL